MTTEQLEKNLMNVFWQSEDIKSTPHSLRLAEYVQHLIKIEVIKAEICGLVFCHPDLNSESGITIKLGSVKGFALKRKIALEQELIELECNK